ncbi:hypothetical protein JR316_0001472 [Psilocybe cubensis]|uniref:Uncharacterized protein n=1 Tax=Psilocybe cubensis TaxID=181762 RepID=A0ACB8HI14_PSICU|nr:hypothetical protein JR316_0001472 [Psilocybe cubensis]KAH9487397.1 hypothetical protein JR316_0001472 [Psilocybe cubensis]
METLDIYGVDSNGTETCYVGRNDNPSFIGSEPLDALGYRIWKSTIVRNLDRQNPSDDRNKH